MSQDYTTTITVAGTPQQAFDAINDVPTWWGRITGTTTAVGDEFVYVVPGLHYSGFRVPALEPGRLVEWVVTGSYLDFVDDHQEWNGTRVRFEIAPAGDGATIVFTHDGLGQEVPCYEICANAWSMFVNGSLKARIETGTGAPYEFRGDEQLLPHEHEALHEQIADAVANR
ncbi:MAG: SRPBCC family protein [Microbacterium sp.]|uniref:SRPBCC family protein n=1 Tax=Microbacterium sp. TaxID=51671 RepID=UPI003F7FB46E